MEKNNIYVKKELQVGCSGCTKCGFPSDMVLVPTFTPSLDLYYHKECYDRLKIKDRRDTQNLFDDSEF